ncbi:MAG: hypothetical protein VCC00_13050 [Deltaproteobacteria bacterium]
MALRTSTSWSSRCAAPVTGLLPCSRAASTPAKQEENLLKALLPVFPEEMRRAAIAEARPLS